MDDAASAVLEALPEGLRFAVDDAERIIWNYTPVPRRGVRLGALDRAQRALVERLVETVLSLECHAKVAAIIALEDVLDRMEGRAFRRSSANYFVSLFGKPGDERWGWRLEGHHVCVNVTAAGDAVSCTPLFLGANPSIVSRGSYEILRPLREEEEAARALLAALDGEQRAAAVVSATAPADILSGNASFLDRALRPGDIPAADCDALALDDRPKGIASSRLDARQRSLLDELVQIYLGRVVPPASAPREVWFAWAGEERPRRPHYYRVQAGGLVIEYDNTQNDANHVHAVWRDRDRDFGRRLTT